MHSPCDIEVFKFTFGRRGSCGVVLSVSRFRSQVWPARSSVNFYLLMYFSLISQSWPAVFVAAFLCAFLHSYQEDFDSNIADTYMRDRKNTQSMFPGWWNQNMYCLAWPDLTFHSKRKKSFAICLFHFGSQVISSHIKQNACFHQPGQCTCSQVVQSWYDMSC